MKKYISMFILLAAFCNIGAEEYEGAYSRIDSFEKESDCDEKPKFDCHDCLCDNLAGIVVEVISPQPYTNNVNPPPNQTGSADFSFTPSLRWGKGLDIFNQFNCFTNTVLSNIVACKCGFYRATFEGVVESNNTTIISPVSLFLTSPYKEDVFITLIPSSTNPMTAPLFPLNIRTVIDIYDFTHVHGKCPATIGLRAAGATNPNNGLPYAIAFKPGTAKLTVEWVAGCGCKKEGCKCCTPFNCKGF